MKLDLSEIAGSVGKRINYTIDEPCGDYESIRCVSPITGNLEFANTGRLIIVRGDFSTTVELECSRCLDSYKLPVVVRVEEQLPISRTPGMAFYDDELDDEDEEEPLFENNIFDLSEYIRQAVMVEAPIKPLCNDLCAGICPTCGKNLNEGRCECQVEVENSPFAALKDAFKDHIKGD